MTFGHYLIFTVLVHGLNTNTDRRNHAVRYFRRQDHWPQPTVVNDGSACDVPHPLTRHVLVRV